MYFPGLEGVVIKETKICHIDLENSKIYYRGYDLEELALNSSFEEVVYLLWFGRLPTRKELEEFKNRLRSARKPPRHVEEIVASAPPGAEPIDVLRTGVSALALGEDLSARDPEDELRRGERITAAMPYIVAVF
ncbi:MAG: citrate/2-methylcitrate synthase, partial [Pyrobaculum sp.]